MAAGAKVAIRRCCATLARSGTTRGARDRGRCQRRGGILEWPIVCPSRAAQPFAEVTSHPPALDGPACDRAIVPRLGGCDTSVSGGSQFAQRAHRPCRALNATWMGIWPPGPGSQPASLAKGPRLDLAVGGSVRCVVTPCLKRRPPSCREGGSSPVVSPGRPLRQSSHPALENGGRCSISWTFYGTSPRCRRRPRPNAREIGGASV